MGVRRQGSRSGPGPPARIELARDGDHLDLVVEGVSYSTYNRHCPWSGYVWDALAATVLLVAEAAPRVLLLGCGGGTVLQLIRRLRPRSRLVAVELDPRVLDVARERFDLDGLGAEVVEGDGVDFVARSRRRFDLVVDDMFGPEGGCLVRPVSDELAHLARLGRRLRPGGVVATNVTLDGDPPDLERLVRHAHRRTFPHGLVLRPALGHNLVVASSARALDRRLIAAEEGFGPAERHALELLRVRRA